MRSSWLLLGLLGVGCAAREVDAPVETEPVAQQVAELDVAPAAEEARARLAQRLDARGLALGPREPVEHAAAWDQERALAALRGATGRAFQAGWSESEWIADDGEYRAAVDARSGRVRVRGLDAYDARLAHAPDDVIRARGAALLAGFATDLPRPQDLIVKHLGGTTRSLEPDVPDEAQNVDERMGSKVFAFRKLGGLPVANNRLVASYLNDGRLLGVRGRWPAIDLERSRLRSDMRADEVVERALGLLVERGVNPHRPEPIVLESFYELRPEGSGWVAVLRASALVVSYNAEGEPGRRERHDFDL
jgi:hypothetical protein